MVYILQYKTIMYDIVYLSVYPATTEPPSRPTVSPLPLPPVSYVSTHAAAAEFTYNGSIVRTIYDLLRANSVYVYKPCICLSSNRHFIFF